MALVGSLCLFTTIISLILSIVAAIFKFNMTKLLAHTYGKSPQVIFNIFFFTKMIYVLLSVFMGFYLLCAFLIRYSIEFITLPEGAKPFTEGRHEVSSTSRLSTTLSLNALVVLFITLHMTQNIYWLKLLSTSWTDLTVRMRATITQESDDDSSESSGEAGVDDDESANDM